MHLDPEKLAELRALVLDMAADLDDVRAAGYRTAYSGQELRVHFRALVRSAGLGAALVEARERYRLQLAGDLLPLAEISAQAPQTDASSDHAGGAR